MSLRSPSKLEILCLKNIALNVIQHGEKLKGIRRNTEIWFRYRVLETFFADYLLTELEHTYRNTELKNNKPLNQFLQLLFSGQIRSIGSMNRCLDLLFNADTQKVSFTNCNQSGISRNLLREVLPRCKNLKSMVLKFYNFTGENCISSVPYRNTLVKVDLLYNHCNDAMVVKLLRQCPNLQIFKAGGELITDRSLYALCSHYTGQKSPKVLNCNGKCGTIGKKIHCLMFNGNSNISCLAAASTLLHLPCLKEFRDTFPTFGCEISAIPYAISHLRNKSLKAAGTPLTLNLDKIYFPPSYDNKEISDILECCPKMKSFGINISHGNPKCFTSESFHSLKSIYLSITYRSVIMSSVFKQLLRMRGHQLESVYIMCFASEQFLELSCLMNLLDQCKNLKTLFLYGVHTGRETESYILSSRNYSVRLQKICLFNTSHQNEIVDKFFTDMLSSSKELRFLGVSSCSVNYLQYALNRNKLPDVEEILLYDVHLANISLKQLIHCHGSLKKITLINCECVIPFVSEHNTAARKCDYDLWINVLEFDVLKEMFLYQYLCGE